MDCFLVDYWEIPSPTLSENTANAIHIYDDADAPSADAGIQRAPSSIVGNRAQVRERGWPTPAWDPFCVAFDRMSHWKKGFEPSQRNKQMKQNQLLVLPTKKASTV